MLMTRNQVEKWFDNSLGKQFNPDVGMGFNVTIMQICSLC